MFWLKGLPWASLESGEGHEGAEMLHLQASLGASLLPPLT